MDVVDGGCHLGLHGVLSKMFVAERQRLVRPVFPDVPRVGGGAQVGVNVFGPSHHVAQVGGPPYTSVGAVSHHLMKQHQFKNSKTTIVDKK